ncbi:MAG: hypothetical protein NTW20_14010 [Rhodobacterales bacterium]|nr:hypothetical protein [Rhodobacterales bacterium]
MTAKPRLILHIGTHKTATSTLQALMAKERPALLKAGICYPRTDHPDYLDQHKHIALAEALFHDDAAFRLEWARVRAEFDASGAHTLVLSAEGLSSPGKSQDNSLGRLRAAADGFDVLAVCLLRRQDSFVESLWNQRAKNGRINKHITDFVQLPAVQRHMTYKDMLDRWATVGRVAAIGFEAARETGVVEAFSAATGIPLPPSPKNRNVSPGMHHAALMAALNKAGVTHSHRWIEQALGADPTRHALGARLRGEILARFTDHNAALLATYGVRFPDTLPEEGADPIPAAGPHEVERYLVALAEKGGGVDSKRKTRRQTRLRDVRKARKAATANTAEQEPSDAPRPAHQPPAKPRATTP